MLRDFARAHHLQHLAQLLLRDSEVELLHRRFGCAINLAIDAVEVARLVWVDIQADGNAVRTPREHGIDVLELLETTRMLAVCRQNVWRAHNLVGPDSIPDSWRL